MKRGLIDSIESPHRARRKACMAKFGMFGNILLSILTIFLNKLLFDKFSFPNLTLTLMHMAITSLCMVVVRKLGYFTPTKLQWKFAIKLSVGFCTFVSCANLSLQHNAIGTFVLLKTATIIWIPMLQFAVKKQYYSCERTLALVPIAFGAMLHFSFDHTLSLTGILFGLISAAATSLYQVYISEKQKEMQVTSLQLLWYEAPISTLLLVPVVCILEPPSSLIGRSFHAEEVYTLMISGVIASIVHFTTQWIVGCTSGTEYNIVSQIKFVCTLLVAYLTFDAKSIVPAQLAGDLIALCGIVIYTHLKMVEVTQSQSAKKDRVVSNARRV